MDFYGWGKTTHAPRFDVDPPAGAKLDGFSRLRQRRDALVEANWSTQGGLQLRVVNEVVMSKRLFDHCQLKVVQGLEHCRVTQRVSTIAVDMNRRIRETVSHVPDHLKFPAWPELQLHSVETLGDCVSNRAQQLLDVIHDTKIRPNLDLTLDAAQKFPQWLPQLACPQVPPRQV
jgi:hypothetical protein